MRKIALLKNSITREFALMLEKLTTKTVYVSGDPETAKKYLTVKEISSEELPPYFFVERKGKNSVAFLLEDRKVPEKPIIVLRQWHGPLGRYNVGAFTGSIDKDLSVLDIVIEEVFEEAGYVVDKSMIKHLATEPVSGNTNEEVHLFIVDVTNAEFKGIHPENVFEKNTFRIRMRLAEVLESCEWKGYKIAQLAYNQVSVKASITASSTSDLFKSISDTSFTILPKDKIKKALSFKNLTVKDSDLSALWEDMQKEPNGEKSLALYSSNGTSRIKANLNAYWNQPSNGSYYLFLSIL